ncbi:hypothetical protein [Paenibacillus glycinis]|uniref:WD40 repeat domain-containing protein n=1 Tax=Paenibacillus glycinis TaxID=2697035 RepID=A0ABW9XYS7_9BACL|nr:hypothetical protein [Paenibacillus glycinis]NBD27386.1 hypothetical protein [Paenibacillus glycinis]
MKRRLLPFVLAFMLPMLVMLPLKTFADVNDKATKALLNAFDGIILDFDASRIVWTSNDKVLWLYNRANGTQVKVYDGTGTTDIVHEAKLSAQGVVYNLNSDPKIDVWPRVSSVYNWKNGQATQIATGEELFAIRGDGKYALLSRHNVDLSTGQVRDLGFDRIEFSADGTMIYSAPVPPVNAFALYQARPDGTITQLAEPSNKVVPLAHGWSYGYYGPLTDGKRILYRELVESNNYAKHVWALRLRNEDHTVATLSVNPFVSYQPGVSYRINNGWIAYIEYDRAISSKVVNVRSPEGIVKRVFVSPHWWSWTSAPLTIDDLGPDGTVAFTFNDKTYLQYMKEDKPVSINRSPAKFQYREQVFGAPGASQIRMGAWYMLSNGSLYAVRI